MPMRLILMASLTIAGCGGNPVVPPPPTPPPTLAACTQTILFQGGGANPSLVLVHQSFSVATAGRLDIILDWTAPASPIGVYVVPAGQCSVDQFNARSCNFLLRSETTQKPRKVSIPSISPGNYDLLVANFADQDESVSVQIILSSTTCPALAFAGAAESSSWEGRALRAGRERW